MNANHFVDILQGLANYPELLIGGGFRMIGTRLEFPIAKLEELPYLQGRRLQFDSVAEMFYTRVQEDPTAIHVLYYDQVITYAQTNQRANQVANYLKEKGHE